MSGRANQNTKTLVSAETLGAMLSLSKRTIHRLNSSARIPSPVRISGSVRWRLEQDIKPWIAMGCPDRKTFEAMKNAGRE